MADAALFRAHAMLPMPATSPDYKLQSTGGGCVVLAQWLSKDRAHRRANEELTK